MSFNENMIGRICIFLSLSMWFGIDGITAMTACVTRISQFVSYRVTHAVKFDRIRNAQGSTQMIWSLVCKQDRKKKTFCMLSMHIFSYNISPQHTHTRFVCNQPVEFPYSHKIKKAMSSFLFLFWNFSLTREWVFVYPL